MGSVGSFLFVYLLGGLTFFPLVLSLVFLFIYLSLPDTPTSPSQKQQKQRQQWEQARDRDLHRPTDDQDSLKSGTDALAEEFHRTHESDVAAGYFAVCREYVPGGVNGKPPERTTPAGEVIAAESPSVYQTMYRSLFDRKQTPSIEPAKTNGKSGKRARNVFYIVLRHGHLMLYDDVNQVEVRYVISLAHHDVNIRGGEKEKIPEGELWLKRNAICLSRRLESLGDLGGPTPPFYLFSENLSEKEDFYFALLQNQAKMWNPDSRPPKCQQFDTRHIVTLVQRLHSSEEQLQTRWINAVLGRLFLALYKTPEMEEFIRGKITKKISRVNKPNFISKIGLRKIDMGEGAPFITNPRLKDLTVDGNCCVETDLQYTGNFRVEISATVRIDLGPRFKAREVDVVLAIVLKKLEGHMLLRFKPPPSNRMWMSFETMPNMVMDIEPVVSSKQITYGIILRTIESRIREVIAESVVLPFWDDVPFLDTFSQPFRGGIWEREIPKHDPNAVIPDESQKQEGNKDESLNVLKSKDDRTMSMPVLSEPAPAAVKSRKGSKSSIAEDPNSPTASSSGVEKLAPLPRAIRSQTFSNAADPVVTADNAKIDKVNDGKSEEKSSATSAMIEISNRSPPSSPDKTAASTPATESLAPPEMPSTLPPSREPSILESLDGVGELGSESRPPSSHRPNSSSVNLANVARSSTTSVGTTTSIGSAKTKRRGTFDNLAKSMTPSEDSKSQASLTFGQATAVAKKWGLNMLGRGEQNAGQDAPRPAGTPEEPIGRGHPLPPPGTPLPHPDRYGGFKRNSLSTKRKPLPPPLPEREGNKRPVPKPPLPRRKPVSSSEESVDQSEDLLVVEAPLDSGPDSPAVDLDPSKGLLWQGAEQAVEDEPPESPVESQDIPSQADDSPKSQEASQSTPPAARPSTPHGMEILSATDGFFP